METSIRVSGKITGIEELKKLFNKAPKVYVRFVRAWFNREGGIFIGTKRKDGIIRRQLTGKKTARGDVWSSRMTHLLKYSLENTNQLNMKMRAGLLYNTKRKVHEIMELLETGGIIRSETFLPIPNYENLPGVKKTAGKLNAMLQRKELRIIYKNRKAYYIDRASGELMFIGQKVIRVKKQYDFYNKWNDLQPAIIERGKKAIDKATKAVQNG